MLTITKRFKRIRAISAGSLAFAIGLTTSAAYVGSELVHDNFSYNKEGSANVSGASTERETPATVAAEAGQESGVPVTNSSLPAATLMTPAPTATAPTVTVSPPVASEPVPTPGMGGGTPPVTTEPEPNPDPLPLPELLCSELPETTTPVPGVNCREP